MQPTYVKIFAFAENHTKKNWYNLRSVLCSSGIGVMLKHRQAQTYPSTFATGIAVFRRDSPVHLEAPAGQLGGHTVEEALDL